MDYKVCRSCQFSKSLDLFFRDRKTKDGHATQCKNCNKEFNSMTELMKRGNKSHYFIPICRKHEWFCPCWSCAHFITEYNKNNPNRLIPIPKRIESHSFQEAYANRNLTDGPIIKLNEILYIK